ncbi:MAG: cyclomaltodextrinase [Lachnospiraceae bacterium]|nr:cyclomaltodextrinase [Lachnospiraceae bacterium]
MWYNEAVFYQFYPLGVCGVPYENPFPADSAEEASAHPILKLKEWIPHLKKLEINAVYFSPLFESDTHGYNTRDYYKIDRRLGTNADFKTLCDALHKEGIRIILDGVFNHVGRGFWAFRDVQEKKWDSPYKDWFHISFDGNSNYNDGFWYEGWEGNFDLVKLNLTHPDVKSHLLAAVKSWIEEFDIDGLRLDVAYMVNRDFLKELRWNTAQWKKDFFLVGEMLHGDYKQIANNEMCHSATNYECYKGIYSALNSMNLFEIIHSLGRQFGPETWTMYKGLPLYSFVDNHDVSRIASILNNPKHIPLAFGLIFGMPGIPQIYYGSEWGIKGDKKNGDPSLRPAIETPEWDTCKDVPSLTTTLAAMAKARKASPALQYGGFKSLVLTNKQCIFEREFSGGNGSQRIMVAINAAEEEFRAHFDARAGRAHDLITMETFDFGGGIALPPERVLFLEPY